MKAFFTHLLQKMGLDEPTQGRDSRLFDASVNGLESDSRAVVPWSTRALQIDASALDADRAMRQLQALWSADKQMQQMPEQTVARLKKYMHFAQVPARQEFIHQDEHGNFLVVLLKGQVAVERTQTWGERLRLSEAMPGEMLGEMSLLDQGLRFSACITQTQCDMAVLTTDAMNDMVAEDAYLVACLMTVLARKMSLRLRVVGARLSERT
jgi:CRP/FNR family cyclic AMP-dependent transcriptional regulator